LWHRERLSIARSVLITERRCGTVCGVPRNAKRRASIEVGAGQPALDPSAVFSSTVQAAEYAPRLPIGGHIHRELALVLFEPLPQILLGKLQCLICAHVCVLVVLIPLQHAVRYPLAMADLFLRSEVLFEKVQKQAAQ
jgi:hypothetical protein